LLAYDTGSERAPCRSARPTDFSEILPRLEKNRRKILPFEKNGRNLAGIWPGFEGSAILMIPKSRPEEWPMRRLVVLALCLPGLVFGQVLLVSEYGTGDVRGFDPVSAVELDLGAGFAPVGGVAVGVDGMVQDGEGRLYVNRADGTIYRSTPEGDAFELFATMPGANGSFFLLDLTADDAYLYSSRFGRSEIYRTALADGQVTVIDGPAAASRFDGVRIGPDGRLYAVESADGRVFALDPDSQTWSLFLAETPSTGEASQLEFDGERILVSRTVAGIGRLHSYALFDPDAPALGADPASELVIGTVGTTSVTGIRIGPDGRAWINAFAAGEVWRSDVGINALEPAPFIVGLDEPGSLWFLDIDRVFADGFETPNVRRELHVASASD